MSQLDQAKKEAKRLFALAKETPINNTPALSLPNLSAALEVIAKINGKAHWTALEQSLKSKDLHNQTPSKSIVKEQLHSGQHRVAQHSRPLDWVTYQFEDARDAPWSHSTGSHDAPLDRFNTPVERAFEPHHAPLPLGTLTTPPNAKKSFFFHQHPTPEPQYCTTSPIVVCGSAGSGKTSAFNAYVSHCAQHHQGFIFWDPQGDPSIYAHAFSCMERADRSDALFCLNFLTDPPRKQTHRIDPLNPMVNCPPYFEALFGPLGEIIHEVLAHTHRQGRLLGIDSLPALLNFSNLVYWHEHATFSTPSIASYLRSLGWDSQQQAQDSELWHRCQSLHRKNAVLASQTLGVLERYAHVFSVHADVVMADVFEQHHGLIILFPALEKAPTELQPLCDLIAWQLVHVEQQRQSLNGPNTQPAEVDQCIIINSVQSMSCNALMHLPLSTTQNHYLFGMEDLESRSDLIAFLCEQATTFLFFRSFLYSNLPTFFDRLGSFFKPNQDHDYPSDPLEFKQRVLNSIRDLRSGHMLAFFDVQSSTPLATFLTAPYSDSSNLSRRIRLIWHNRPILQRVREELRDRPITPSDSLSLGGDSPLP